MVTKLDQNFGVQQTDVLFTKARELAQQEKEQEHKRDLEEKRNHAEIADTEVDQLDADTELARSTITNLLVKGEDLMDELIVLAKDSEAPRAYEVASTMLNTLAGMAKDLMDVHEKKRRTKSTGYSAKNPTPAIGSQQNIIFQGSSSDLLTQLRAARALEKVHEVPTVNSEEPDKR